MKFNYLDYSSDMFDLVTENSPAKVFVFDNPLNKNKAEEYYSKSFLEKESLFTTFSELKEKLFPVERLLLKEEKRTVILYELLDKEEKNKLKIDDYFDIIDLAADFFAFFDELNEYNIGTISGLKDWQQEKFKILQNLRQKYIDYMKKSGYTDKTLRYRFDNFNPHYLEEYDEIVFVNIVDFTPKEKDILNKLETEGKNVELYLQLYPQDFDEENLILKSMTLPEKLSNEVDIYQTSEDLLQLINILPQLDSSSDSIIDANFNNSNYHKILSSEQIKVDKELYFTQTEIFRFLESLYELLKNADFKGKNIKIRMADLLNSCYQDCFRNYYNISDVEFNNLYQLADEDYVYFCEKLIDKGLENFKTILKDLEQISEYKTLSDFVEFLEDIDIELLNDREFKNNHEQYFDSLVELCSLDKMGLVSSWSKYFDSRAAGLFRLIINYLRYKKVKKIEEDDEQTLEIKNMNCAEDVKRDLVYILNANSGVIPNPPGKDFLLTEKQREKIGLPTSKKNRIKEKYNFYRHILNCNKVIIYYLENIDKNQTASSFVEELKLHYNLETKEPEVSIENYTEVVNSIFSPEGNPYSEYLLSHNSETDILGIEQIDFPDEGFSISYYKFNRLKDCYYRFYLEHIAGLEEEKIEFEEKLNRKVLGIIVHEMFEDIIRQLKEEIQTGELKPNKDLIDEVVSQKIDSYSLKIPNYFLSYYQNIIIPRIQRSIKSFFSNIKRKTGKNIDRVLTEWTPGNDGNFIEHEKTSFYLNGRIDLVFYTDSETHLVDFKTGGGNMKQLDFYSLLIESDLDGERRIRKHIYSVMDEKLKEGYSKPEKLEEKLDNEIREFIDGDQYTAIYKTRCKRCEYQDICRVVIK